MADPAESKTLREGEIRDLSGKVCGDFRILRRLGVGGMGQVYLAEQVSLKRKVALKFLKRELSANKSSLERFRRESQELARVNHANIVQIYAVGESDGQQFMALEYVEGRNLREFIERKGPVDLRLGLRIMGQVAAALQQSSDLGIVHRDIKPENILINRKGEVKVTDFGLSRRFTEDSNLTKSRIAMGTPLYMSPEQVEGTPVDHRSDIYSFGVTCYYLFSGRPPFRGETPFEVALQHVNKEPTPLAEFRPDLPPEVCASVHKMMAKKPGARYQSGREIAREVARFRESAISGGQPSVTGLGDLEPVNTMTGVSPVAVTLTASSVGGPGRVPWAFAGFFVGMLALGVGCGWLLTPPPTVAVSAPSTPPENHSEPPPAVKELFFKGDREKEQLRKVQESVKQPLDRGLGLEPAMDLGSSLLRQRRYDDAEALFKELAKSDRRVWQHRFLSQFGQAMVLAGRDKFAESNKLFVETLDAIDQLDAKFDAAPGKFFEKKDKTAQRNAITGFWRQNIAWREQMAAALDRNHANSPDTFPADPRLQALRKPPTAAPTAGAK